MLSDNTMDSDKSSGVTISHQMSTLYFPSDDAQGVRTDLKGLFGTCNIKDKELGSTEVNVKWK